MPKGDRWTADEAKRAATLRAEGMTFDEIGARVGRSRASVSRALSLLKAGRQFPADPPPSDKPADRIVALATELLAQDPAKQLETVKRQLLALTQEQLARVLSPYYGADGIKYTALPRHKPPAEVGQLVGIIETLVNLTMKIDVHQERGAKSGVGPQVIVLGGFDKLE